MNIGPAVWGTIAKSVSRVSSERKGSMPVSKQLAVEFRNEPYTDFSSRANLHAMEAALAAVRAQFGREYDLRIASERLRTPDKLKSVNPSNPAEVVGIHQKATPAMATQAIEVAQAFFPIWSA